MNVLSAKEMLRAAVIRLETAVRGASVTADDFRRMREENGNTTIVRALQPHTPQKKPVLPKGW